jgi:hypothetical protein
MTTSPPLGDDARALTPDELRDALQLKPSTFYKHQSLGQFERFELRPRIGPRRYSRKLVQAYLDGERSERGWAQPAGRRA